jgi:uncharacterized protein HemX
LFLLNKQYPLFKQFKNPEMKRKIVIALLVALGFTVTSVSAQTIRQKSTNERHRIKQGVKSGELTKAEARNLAHDQKAIRRDVKEARRDDGKIDRTERKEIKKDQRQASREIYRKKHNARDRH